MKGIEQCFPLLLFFSPIIPLLYFLLRCRLLAVSFWIVKRAREIAESVSYQ